MTNNGMCAGGALTLAGLGFLGLSSLQTLAAQVTPAATQDPVLGPATNLGMVTILAGAIGFFFRHMLTKTIPEIQSSNQKAFADLAVAHERAIQAQAMVHEKAIAELVAERRTDRALYREDLAADRTMRERALAEAMRELRERFETQDRRSEDRDRMLEYIVSLLTAIRERGCKNMTGGGAGLPSGAEDSGILLHRKPAETQSMPRPRRPDPPKGDKPEGGKK